MKVRTISASLYLSSDIFPAKMVNKSSSNLIKSSKPSQPLPFIMWRLILKLILSRFGFSSFIKSFKVKSFIFLTLSNSGLGSRIKLVLAQFSLVLNLEHQGKQVFQQEYYLSLFLLLPCLANKGFVRFYNLLSLLVWF